MSTITSRITKVALLVVVLIFGFSGVAHAQRFRGRVGGRIVPRWNYSLGIRPFHDPFWGPYYPYGFYYPYGIDHATVRVQAVPKQTEVFVDGYCAGTAGNVRTTSVVTRLPCISGVSDGDGEHLRGGGFHVRERHTMQTLNPGEVIVPPPMPSRALHRHVAT